MDYDVTFLAYDDTEFFTEWATRHLYFCISELFFQHILDIAVGLLYVEYFVFFFFTLQRFQVCDQNTWETFLNIAPTLLHIFLAI